MSKHKDKNKEKSRSRSKSRDRERREKKKYDFFNRLAAILIFLAFIQCFYHLEIFFYQNSN